MTKEEKINMIIGVVKEILYLCMDIYTDKELEEIFIKNKSILEYLKKIRGNK